MSFKTMEEQITDPLLRNYRVAERRAILVHKYFLGIEMGYDPGLPCAITSWESRVANSWRREQQITDCQAQLAEIERYKVQLVQQRGYDVGWDDAAREWIRNHAADWRRRHEEQTGSHM